MYPWTISNKVDDCRTSASNVWASIRRHEDATRTKPRFSQLERHVSRHSEEPRRDPRDRTHRVHAPKRAHEGLLRRVGGERRVTQEIAQEPVNRGRVVGVKRRQDGPVLLARRGTCLHAGRIEQVRTGQKRVGNGRHDRNVASPGQKLQGRAHFFPMRLDPHVTGAEPASHRPLILSVLATRYARLSQPDVRERPAFRGALRQAPPRAGPPVLL